MRKLFRWLFGTHPDPMPRYGPDDPDYLRIKQIGHNATDRQLTEGESDFKKWKATLLSRRTK